MKSMLLYDICFNVILSKNAYFLTKTTLKLTSGLQVCTFYMFTPGGRLVYTFTAVVCKVCAHSTWCEKYAVVCDLV